MKILIIEDDFNEYQKYKLFEIPHEIEILQVDLLQHNILLALYLELLNGGILFEGFIVEFEKIITEKFDLMIIDYELKPSSDYKYNGLKLLQNFLLKEPKFSTIPFILFTGIQDKKEINKIFHRLIENKLHAKGGWYLLLKIEEWEKDNEQISLFKTCIKSLEKKRSFRAFISYSHEDKSEAIPFIQELKKTRILDENISVENWADLDINVGENWYDKLTKRLDESEIGIFLLSSSFFNSDFCTDNELQSFLSKMQSKLIFPILLRTNSNKLIKDIMSFSPVYADFGINKEGTIAFDQIYLNFKSDNRLLNTYTKLYFSYLHEELLISIKTKFAVDL